MICVSTKIKIRFFFDNRLSKYQYRRISFRHTYNFADDISGVSDVNGNFDCIAFQENKPDPFIVLNIKGVKGKFLLSNISDLECDPALKDQLLLLLTNRSRES